MAKSLGRTSLILASGTMISRVLGFVKAIVLAQTIGLVGSVSADAFANASSLPTNIYSLIAGGLLNAVLVPQIVRATKNVDGGKQYVNRLITLAIVVLGSLTLLVTLGAPIIAKLYGLTLDDEQLSLVIAFAYWCLPQVFFYSLYAVISEVLNARSIFMPFAWAPVLNNIISIAGLIMFAQLFGADPSGEGRAVSDWSPMMTATLAGSASLGVIVQAMVLFLFLPRAGFRYRPDFHFRGTGLGRIGSVASWSLGMVVVIQVVAWVETLAINVAFGQTVSLAASRNAEMIFLLPHAIIAVSLTTMMFTSLSEYAAERKTETVISEFSRGARTITMFMVFSTVALMVMAPPFARIFSSSPEQANQLAVVLMAQLLGLVGFSLFYFSNRVNFAYEDTRTVFIIYAATAPIHIAGVVAAAMFLPVEFIAVGIALLNAFLTTLRLLIQLQVLRKRVLGRIDGHRLLRATIRFAIGTIPTAAIGILIVWGMGGYSLDGWGRSSLLNAFITCALSGVAMIAAYAAAMVMLKSPEFDAFFAPMMRRIFGAPGRHSTKAHRHAAHTAEADRFAAEHGTLFTLESAAAAYASTTPVAPSNPDTELAADAMHTTSRIPTRRELREYARQRESEAYLQQIVDDDETLI